MLSYISGQVIFTAERSVIIQTSNGLGYTVYLSGSQQPEIDATVKYFLYQHLREDASDLYGFTSFTEKEFFEQLISINGIGPKSALEIMTLPLMKIQEAIAAEDVKSLTKIKGLGKKTAERLILELKGKLPNLEELGSTPKTEGQIAEDTLIALVQLGYKRAHIERVFDTANEPLLDTETQIRYFLQNA